MRKRLRHIFAGLALGVFAVVVWQVWLQPDSGLALKIERDLVKQHPNFPMGKFARFYAHEARGTVRGVYLLGDEEYPPYEGEMGRSYWVRYEDLPEPYDGGCSVVTLEYVKLTGTLFDVSCH